MIRSTWSWGVHWAALVVGVASVRERSSSHQNAGLIWTATEYDLARLQKDGRNGMLQMVIAMISHSCKSWLPLFEPLVKTNAIHPLVPWYSYDIWHLANLFSSWGYNSCLLLNKPLDGWIRVARVISPGDADVLDAHARAILVGWDLEVS